MLSRKYHLFPSLGDGYCSTAGAFYLQLCIICVFLAVWLATHSSNHPLVENGWNVFFSKRVDFVQIGGNVMGVFTTLGLFNNWSRMWFCLLYTIMASPSVRVNNILWSIPNPLETLYGQKLTIVQVYACWTSHIGWRRPVHSRHSSSSQKCSWIEIRPLTTSSPALANCVFMDIALGNFGHIVYNPTSQAHQRPHSNSHVSHRLSTQMTVELGANI